MRPSRNEEAWESRHFIHHRSLSRRSSLIVATRSATESPVVVATRRSSLVFIAIHHSSPVNRRSIKLSQLRLKPKYPTNQLKFQVVLRANVDSLCGFLIIIKDVDDTASTFWFYVGNEVIRFSAVEFCLVTGFTFGDSCESPSYITKHMDKRILRSYFQDGKVNVKMFGNWFRNLGPDNNVSDDDMVKLALVLFLEMTLVGKDDRNAIMYWALQLVDDLDAFNSFPWGTFLYCRIFDSLYTCVVGCDDKYKERLESPAKRKAKKYNVYRFVTDFQVWAIKAIPKWAMLGYASRYTIFKYLVPSDEEIRKPYWASIDQSQFPIDPMIVSPEKFDCGVDDDDFEVDVQEDIDNVEEGAEKKYDDCKDDI
ncbi:hypothetical protein Ddye_016543 [Dipteronia dyeriana]|uniref:DUF1985 domain-containing protein n=1 Tax=Dipteronia dyeriana TaxID=168575 RepID=A0AAD9U7V6_9ROSI|nr:hypothetical protein Ddye_016543 [Dipteronia dyeriana]